MTLTESLSTHWHVCLQRELERKVKAGGPKARTFSRRQWEAHERAWLLSSRKGVQKQEAQDWYSRSVGSPVTQFFLCHSLPYGPPYPTSPSDPRLPLGAPAFTLAFLAAGQTKGRVGQKTRTAENRLLTKSLPRNLSLTPYWPGLSLLATLAAKMDWRCSLSSEQYIALPHVRDL